MPVDWSYLNIVFRELLGQRSPASSSGVHSVVDGNLTILMVKPCIDVFATLLEDLLAQHDGRGCGVWEEVILWYVAARTNSGTTIVPKMENASLDSEPGKVASHGDTYMGLSPGWKTDHDDCYPAGVEESPRHGAIELGRGHILVVSDIVDSIDESRALPPVSWRVGRNLGRPA